MKSAIVRKIGSAMVLMAAALSLTGTETAFGLSFEDDELRSHARDDAGVVTRVNREARITRVLKVNKDWVQVETSSGLGWIKNKDYKKLLGEKEEQTLVLKTGAEIRSKGGMESSVLARASGPTVVNEILFSGNFWYKVATNKGIGWVRKSQVEGGVRTEAKAPCVDCANRGQRRASPVSGGNIRDIGDAIAEATQTPPARRVAGRKQPVVHHKHDGHDHSHDNLPETPAMRRAVKQSGQKFISPIPGGNCLTSGFGPRGRHPVTGAANSIHKGQDWRASVGTPLVAVTDGEIIAAGRAGRCGNMIQIKTGGTVITYCHLSRMSVRVGQRVSQGQSVGASGATGGVTGPHLHIGVSMNGQPVNPGLIFNLNNYCPGYGPRRR